MAMEALSLLVLLALSVTVAFFIKSPYRRRVRGPLPPGPRPLPIIGNMLDFPQTNIWQEFSELSRRYGDIMYFNILGQPVIVLNSVQIAFDLLDKKSANYSGRPTTVFIKLLGFDLLFSFMQYGRKWRQHRRAFHHSFGQDRVACHESVQLNSAHRFLGRLLQAPQDLPEHLHRLVSDTAMRTVYGIDMDAQRSDTELYAAVDQLSQSADRVRPSSHLIEVFPGLRHLPSWLPGMGIKRMALEGRRALHDALQALHVRFTAASESDGEEMRDCLVSRILERDESGAGAAVREMSQYVAATAYLAGTDTVHSLLQGFFLAMAMHPGIQKKAQDELDAVVGMDRLPDFSDREALPYVHAILKEVMRWHIIVPMGMPHLSTADEEHDGFFIPAGTVISANIWAMSRDLDEYPDPECFRPERFLVNKPPRDPAEYVYGFGRRICPGRHFNMAAAFIYLASILHVFDIQPPLDEQGVPIKLEYRPTGVFICHLRGYPYIIKPRSQQVERLVTEYVKSD